MHWNFANRRVEYKESVDLLDQPSHLKIGLCWYQKYHGSLWTYDLTNHIMMDLGIINYNNYNNFCSRKYLYELHPMDEKMFNYLYQW